MAKRLWYLIGGWLALAAPSPLRADHLVGGDLTMTYLGKPGLFRITMNQYWNETNNTGDYSNDAQQEVFVFSRRTNTFMNSILLRQTHKQPVTYQNPACARANRLQTVEVRFDSLFQFDSRYTDPEGYYLVWERCCRNGSVMNIRNPAQTGFVLYLQFPPPTGETPNSSPNFTLAAGDYVCLNQAYQLNFSAQDSDGDQLTYRLVTPWAGYTNPAQRRGTVISRSSYPTVVWQDGFSDGAVIPGPAPLRIDPNTGILSLTAGQTGLFAFAVEVTESRNGHPIGVARREFQLLVTDCSKTLLSPPVITRSGQPVETVTLCDTDSATLAVPPGTDYTYQWQRDRANLPNATSATFTASVPGLYTVVKSATGGCARDTVSQPVQVIRSTATTVRFDSLLPICEPNISPIMLTASPLGGQFTGPGVTGTRFDPAIAGVGQYVLTYSGTDAAGCRFSARRTAIVQQPVRLTVPTGINLRRGDTVVLAASSSEPLATAVWSPSNGLSNAYVLRPGASPQQSQTYVLRVTTPAGCTATAEVPVTVLGGVHIPSAFSPNGDGLNDTWELKGVITLPTCEVTIFDRWGSVLFHSTGYAQPWDGTHQGKPVERGVYTYQIRLTDQPGTYRGSLTVLR
ncbi:gliding motility-associated C-terminal domain-containing protein [Spirosoma taeanense]|uniref:Gliding motility-associated C-terminal domain-containing protein n=1 Tax=Spirosoma taeanense TaxID=2735870 RepID=A0A6M5Y6V9_9BACT|nr:gliding motility-associated C-terminal domain-containing protein [Spirosoma taeanense]QJW88442.1 gliding motility-associated C-terminal domain-containing protein [Spirosoma taeanense]